MFRTYVNKNETSFRKLEMFQNGNCSSTNTNPQINIINHTCSPLIFLYSLLHNYESSKFISCSWCGTCHMTSFVTSHSWATTAAIISQALLPESTSSPRPSNRRSLVQYFVPLLPSLMHSCKLSPYCQGILIWSSCLGAYYVSVLRKTCTWIYKQANFSQMQQYHQDSCLDNISSSTSFDFSTACLPWRSHSQSTSVCPVGPMPSRLVFVLEIPYPVDYSLP